MLSVQLQSRTLFRISKRNMTCIKTMHFKVLFSKNPVHCGAVSNIPAALSREDQRRHATHRIHHAQCNSYRRVFWWQTVNWGLRVGQSSPDASVHYQWRRVCRFVCQRPNKAPQGLVIQKYRCMYALFLLSLFFIPYHARTARYRSKLWMFEDIVRTLNNNWK